MGGMNGPLFEFPFETKPTLEETLDVFTESVRILSPKFKGRFNERSSGTSGGVGIGFNGGGPFIETWTF